jgi:hypothetical protein
MDALLAAKPSRTERVVATKPGSQFTTEFVKAEVVRRAIEADRALSAMLEASLAQVALDIELIPLEEARAQLRA